MKWKLNEVAALEKAIREKYGEQAITNPKGTWNPEKEAEYIEEIKKAYLKEVSEREKSEIDGVLVDKKLINKVIDRSCKYCSTLSFKRNDDVYLTKFQSCFKCYILNIEGR
jgi:hypothetical protein